MLQGSRLDIFPAPVLNGECHNWDACDQICELARNHQAHNKDLLLVSGEWDNQHRSMDEKLHNTHGVTSFGTDHLLHELDEWQGPTELILGMAKELLRHIDEELCNKAWINSMWYSIYPEGGYIPEHTHSNALFSGVFYAKAEKGAGNLIFHDPAWVAKSMVMDTSYGKQVSQTRYGAEVSTGSMYLFPGWLPHSSVGNTSGEDRIIIGFNLSF
jgi:uncharacterized protein (TIGR02466 family)